MFIVVKYVASLFYQASQVTDACNEAEQKATSLSSLNKEAKQRSQGMTLMLGFCPSSQ